MLTKRIPVFYVLTAAVLSCCISAGAVWVGKENKTNEATVEATIAQEQQQCALNTQQLGGFHYIHPVYLAENGCEAPQMQSMKAGIDNFVQSMKPAGLSSASVYVRDLQNNDWMIYTGTERYHPGSMFKIVTLMTLFKTATTVPGFMDQKLLFAANAPIPPAQTFNSKTIIPGNTYSIKQLIRSMIVYSDNYATMLLHSVTDERIFKQIFADLSLTPPDVHASDYTVTAQEYSRFIDVLYDGRYLSLPASETAITLLSESDFTLGVRKFLPPELTIAHKFGESGKPGKQEMHETAIVYLENRPYLITIMTKGTNSYLLADVIAQISKIAFDNMVYIANQHRA